MPMGNELDILLVEDSRADARFTREILKETCVSHRLTTVPDGVEALQYLFREGKYSNATKPDVIILDLNMPRKTGHDVLSAIRKRPELEPIPVILLTVSENPTDVATAMHLKMNYYVRKPVPVDTLRALLITIQDLWLCAG
jgi:CheY-like chemotaxis protein